MTTQAKTRALSWLEQRAVLHMGMIEALRRGDAKLLCAEDGGVLLFERKSGAYMLSAGSPEAGERLLEAVGPAGLFVAHQDFMVPILTQRFGLNNKFDCRQAVYLGGEALPACDNTAISVLRRRHEGTVLDHYRTTDDAPYIRNRIAGRQMFGAFVNGNLAGFIGVHSEGSMGFLEVLPEYRRMGLGAALESYLVNLHLQKGWTPFCQIFADNEPSLRLQRKLGLEVSEEHMYWLF